MSFAKTPSGVGLVISAAIAVLVWQSEGFWDFARGDDRDLFPVVLLIVIVATILVRYRANPNIQGSSRAHTQRDVGTAEADSGEAHHE